MLAIRLPATIEKRLERLAKRTGRTKTYYAREASFNTWKISRASTSLRSVWRTFARGALKRFRSKK